MKLLIVDLNVARRAPDSSCQVLMMQADWSKSFFATMKPRTNVEDPEWTAATGSRRRPATGSREGYDTRGEAWA